MKSMDVDRTKIKIRMLCVLKCRGMRDMSSNESLSLS